MTIPIWVGKLTGKPVALSIADCESEARRIQLPNHATGVSLWASESKAFRIQPDLLCQDPPCWLCWLSNGLFPKVLMYIHAREF
jgi:hypothetical protein